MEEKLINEQRKYIDMLIGLKSIEIRNWEFKNFHGTVEELELKNEEVNKKINFFRKNVYKAFSNIYKD